MSKCIDCENIAFLLPLYNADLTTEQLTQQFGATTIRLLAQRWGEIVEPSRTILCDEHYAAFIRAVAHFREAARIVQKQRDDLAVLQARTLAQKYLTPGSIVRVSLEQHRQEQ